MSAECVALIPAQVGTPALLVAGSLALLAPRDQRNALNRHPPQARPSLRGSRAVALNGLGPPRPKGAWAARLLLS
jgi:hypothetical protein